MDQGTEYDFCVSVWLEDDEWNYSVIQEFDEDETEVLFYGTEDTKAEAFAQVRDFIVTQF